MENIPEDVKEKIFKKTAESLGGTCMTSASSVLEFYYKEVMGKEAEYQTLLELEEDFGNYQVEVDQYECEHCGWVTYPGEQCECGAENLCDECACPIEECECDTYEEEEE